MSVLKADHTNTANLDWSEMQGGPATARSRYPLSTVRAKTNTPTPPIAAAT